MSAIETDSSLAPTVETAPGTIAAARTPFFSVNMGARTPQ